MAQEKEVRVGRVVIPAAALEWQFVRSSGPGGQHVNRTSTKAVLRFDARHSPHLPEDVRSRLLEREQAQLTRDGALVIASQRHRDQSRNVADCLEKLAALLEQWHLTHTASLEAASREGEEGELSSLLLDQAAQRLAAEQERAEQEDPQRAALPHLLAELNEQQRRLIWHRYQRRLPLSPAQLRRVMRLDDRQLAELEQEALQALRAAAARLELSANAGSQATA